MIQNWGYLILYNGEYWVPFMAVSANTATRDNLTVLPNEARNLYFNSAGEVEARIFR